MIVIYPGLGLGRTERPVIAFTLGYLKSVSSLAPVDSIIGVEPIIGIIVEQPGDVVSIEDIPALEGLEPEDIVVLEPDDVESLESFGYITVVDLLYDFPSLIPNLTFFGTVSAFARVAVDVELGAGKVITEVAPILRKLGTPTNNVVVELYESDGVSDPDTGTLLATGTIPVSEVTDSLTYVPLAFDPPVVTTTARTAIVLSVDGPLSDTGAFYSQYGTTLAGPLYWSESAAVWSSQGGSLLIEVSGEVKRFGSVVAEEPSDIIGEQPDDVTSEEPI